MLVLQANPIQEVAMKINSPNSTNKANKNSNSNNKINFGLCINIKQELKSTSPNFIPISTESITKSEFTLTRKRRKRRKCTFNFGNQNIKEQQAETNLPTTTTTTTFEISTKVILIATITILALTAINGEQQQQQSLVPNLTYDWDNFNLKKVQQQSIIETMSNQIPSINKSSSMNTPVHNSSRNSLVSIETEELASKRIEAHRWSRHLIESSTGQQDQVFSSFKPAQQKAFMLAEGTTTTSATTESSFESTLLGTDSSNQSSIITTTSNELNNVTSTLSLAANFTTLSPDLNEEQREQQLLQQQQQQQQQLLLLGTTNENLNETLNLNQGVQELSAFQAAKLDYFRHSITVSVIITIAYTVVFIVGIVGNSFVVAIVCKSPRMRTVTNYFIVNLAFADILVLLFCIPATLIGNLFIPYVLGQFVCKSVSYLQGVAVSASIYTMVAVTMDRFLAICFPMDWHMSRKAARWTIACIWLFSLSIALPWAIYFTLVNYQIDPNTNIHLCNEVWPSEKIGNLYFVCANLILLYLFPAIVIILCYLGIWYKIERRNIPGDRPKGLKIELIMQKSKLKVVKMMMVVVVIFLLSWLPLYMIFARIKLAEERSQWEEWFIPKMLPLAQWLGASNSCMNPILYTFFNRKYKQGFADFLRVGLRCGFKSKRNKQRETNNNNNNAFDIGETATAINNNAGQANFLNSSSIMTTNKCQHRMRNSSNNINNGTNNLNYRYVSAQMNRQIQITTQRFTKHCSIIDRDKQATDLNNVFGNGCNRAGGVGFIVEGAVSSGGCSINDTRTSSSALRYSDFSSNISDNNGQSSILNNNNNNNNHNHQLTKKHQPIAGIEAKKASKSRRLFFIGDCPAKAQNSKDTNVLTTKKVMNNNERDKFVSTNKQRVSSNNNNNSCSKYFLKAPNNNDDDSRNKENFNNDDQAYLNKLPEIHRIRAYSSGASNIPNRGGKHQTITSNNAYPIITTQEETKKLHKPFHLSNNNNNFNNKDSQRGSKETTDTIETTTTASKQVCVCLVGDCIKSDFVRLRKRMHNRKLSLASASEQQIFQHCREHCKSYKLKRGQVEILPDGSRRLNETTTTTNYIEYMEDFIHGYNRSLRHSANKNNNVVGSGSVPKEFKRRSSKRKGKHDEEEDKERQQSQQQEEVKLKHKDNVKFTFKSKKKKKEKEKEKKRKDGEKSYEKKTTNDNTKVVCSSSSFSSSKQTNSNSDLKPKSKSKSKMRLKKNKINSSNNNVHRSLKSNSTNTTRDTESTDITGASFTNGTYPTASVGNNQFEDSSPSIVVVDMNRSMTTKTAEAATATSSSSATASAAATVAAAAAGRTVVSDLLSTTPATTLTTALEERRLFQGAFPASARTQAATLMLLNNSSSNNNASNKARQRRASCGGVSLANFFNNQISKASGFISANSTSNISCCNDNNKDHHLKHNRNHNYHVDDDDRLNSDCETHLQFDSNLNLASSVSDNMEDEDNLVDGRVGLLNLGIDYEQVGNEDYGDGDDDEDRDDADDVDVDDEEEEEESDEEEEDDEEEDEDDEEDDEEDEDEEHDNDDDDNNNDDIYGDNDEELDIESDDSNMLFGSRNNSQSELGKDEMIELNMMNKLSEGSEYIGLSLAASGGNLVNVVFHKLSMRETTKLGQTKMDTNKMREELPELKEKYLERVNLVSSSGTTVKEQHKQPLEVERQQQSLVNNMCNSRKTPELTSSTTNCASYCGGIKDQIVAELGQSSYNLTTKIASTNQTTRKGGGGGSEMCDLRLATNPLPEHHLFEKVEEEEDPEGEEVQEGALTTNLNTTTTTTSSLINNQSSSFANSFRLNELCDKQKDNYIYWQPPQQRQRQQYQQTLQSSIGEQNSVNDKGKVGASLLSSTSISNKDLVINMEHAKAEMSQTENQNQNQNQGRNLNIDLNLNLNRDQNQNQNRHLDQTHNLNKHLNNQNKNLNQTNFEQQIHKVKTRDIVIHSNPISH